MKIAEARKRRGLTQATLAAKVGVSRAAVAMWETDKCRPEPTTAMELAKCLGMRLEQVYQPQRRAA